MKDQQVEWRPVPAWMSEEHEVSSDGRVRRTVRADRGESKRGGANWKAGHELSTCQNTGGYRSVSLRGRSHSVHRIVLEAFKGAPPFEGAVGRHLDDNKLNNTVSNLAWGTMAENAADARRNGRVARVPLRFDRSEAIRLRESGLTYRQVGAALGVSHVAVMNGLKAA